MPILIAIFSRLGASAGLSRVLGFVVPIVLIVALLGGLWLWLDHREAVHDKANQEIGAAVQREGDLQVTIKRTEQANETRDQVRRDLNAGGSRELYDQCVRTARTPANCVRFMPGGQADKR